MKEHDYLVKLGQNRALRQLIRALGLPAPVKLQRDSSAWQQQALRGKTILLGGEGSMYKPMQAMLKPLGAIETGEKLHGLLFDTTSIGKVEDLDTLYHFFRKHLAKLQTCSRVLLLCRDPRQQQDTEQQAVTQAIEGFTRSLAKEIGRKGSTAQLLVFDEELIANPQIAEPHLQSTLHFFLSDRPAFVSGQVIQVNGQIRATAILTKPLQDKVALVTGAAQGIGEATARTLAREGARVVVLDRPQEQSLLDRVASDIKGSPLAVDLADNDSADAIAAHIEREFSGVDIIVHNAGITRDKTLARMGEEQWHQTLRINFAAIVETTRKLNDNLLRENGRIICMSSISGIAGNYGQSNYTTCKAGLIGFVAGLARELKPRNITANAIAPGFIETRMTARMPFFTREAARRINSLGQGGLPQDIAEAIAFLCSPGASGISGQTLRVCGGHLMGA